MGRERLWAAALTPLLMCSCGDDGPSSPSPSRPSTGVTTTAPAPAGGTVAGRVVDFLTGAPVPAARVRVAGSDAFPVDSDGTFRVERASAARVSVLVEASGYWTRETGMLPAPSTQEPVELALLPADGDFDLGFFDHVFRDVGEGGTHPWTSEPVFEIWEGSYECTAFTEGDACEELTARGEAAPASFIEQMRSVIENDARRYTDGAVLGSRITTRSHPAGTVIARSEFIEPGKVTLAFVIRPDRFSWAFWQWAGDGSMRGAHVHLNRNHRGIRGVYSHELAHTLGFAHPLGVDRVPLSSIMRRGHGDEPTRADLLHARVLYARPPNNRTPDVDPTSYSLTGLRFADASGQGGEDSAP